MPKIAGVANGALLLRDKALANMDLETFQIVARPKVEGTTNLDQLFKDEPLDFFIPFSSIVATTGNMGQMAYSAGNCFTKAIVAQRRARGLAGSVIDISRVLGVGYVERETKVQGRLTRQEAERLMTRSGTLAMSEPDLHQLFAEAVLAGRPNSTKNPEIITGVHPLTSEEADLAFWGGNVKFSHLIQNNRDVGVEKDSQSAKVPVKAELAAAKGLEDAARIINSTCCPFSAIPAMIFQPVTNIRAQRCSHRQIEGQSLPLGRPTHRHYRPSE